MKSGRRQGALAAGLSVLLAAPTGAAHAQGDPGQVALPDLDAIEKGARTRASVSFGGPMEAPAGTGPAGAEAQRNDREGTVKRITTSGPDVTRPPAGIYGLDPSALGGPWPSDRPAPDVVPEQHVVRKGDTLWSICDLNFRDPWRWPKVWAQNPHVTNPHWIFPGDVLRLRQPGEAPAPPPPPPVAGIRSTRRGSLVSNALVLREIGFIEAENLGGSARIAGSREEKILLATGDQAYVSFAKDRPLRAGERYTVFVADTANPVKAPDTGRVLGYLVRIYGDVVVDQVSDKQMARGTLLDLVDPVERGFAVSPHVRQFKRIEPRPSAVSLEARIVASFTPANLLASENFVVISRGRKDGLEVGNRSFVVRRGDGHRSVMEDWDAQDGRFPKEVVGELWILDVRDNASVAWVARTAKEIRVGEVTEVRRGY